MLTCHQASVLRHIHEQTPDAPSYREVNARADHPCRPENREQPPARHFFYNNHRGGNNATLELTMKYGYCAAAFLLVKSGHEYR